MSQISALCEHLHPDSVKSLQRAAELRFADANKLHKEQELTAIYLYGYCAEMCLLAACFRRAGFTSNETIDRDTRHRRMVHARTTKAADGAPLMNGDPHPIVGWARLLQWTRSAEPGLPDAAVQYLNEAINKAKAVYKHWRPELRYKTTKASPRQVAEARKAAEWFLQNQNDL